MLSELIMRRYGWDAIWCPEAADPPVRRTSPWVGRCLVGTWTGPDADLLCVKPCETSEEAERFLSPMAHSILGAVLRAAWHRWKASRTRGSQ